MSKPFSSDLGTGLRLLSWPSALIGIVVIKAALSFAVKPGSFLVSYSGISYFLLLLLATSFAVRNGIQDTLGSRPFWVFLAIAYGLWSLDQSLSLYYECGLHIEVPNNSIADPVLFLHIVPLMAAVTTLPHRNVSDHKLYRAILNSLPLLFFWSFLYGYIVFPYQYLFSSSATPSSYAMRFDILYLLENLALVLAVGMLTLRVQAPWKSIYLHLLGASTLYALSSAVANLAIDSGGYVNGKLYGLGLSASVCWFVWIPLRARQLTGTDESATRSDGGRDPLASVWAMLAVVMISTLIVWQLFRWSENPGRQTLRLVVAVVTLVALASAAFTKGYLDKREMASRIGLAHDRLRLAIESAKSVGWDWDLKSGTDVWFGDLKTVFGIPSDHYVGHENDILSRVHPDDRENVRKALEDARQDHQPFAAECRILWPDGTVRWITTQGKFYYVAIDEPARMLGMAVDVTEKKHAERELRESHEKLLQSTRLQERSVRELILFRALLDQSNDAIQVIEPGTLRFLDVNDRTCLDFGYTREELLSMTVYDIAPGFDEMQRGKVLEQIKESGSAIFERVHRRRDGTTFPVEVTVRQVHLDQTYGIAVARDITERKRAEARLREYEKALEGLEEMIVVVDREYRYVIANRAFLDFRGQQKEQVVGHLASEILGKEVFETIVKKQLDECLQGKVVTYELKYTYPKRGERNLFISYFPIEGPNGVDRVVSVLQDITERTRAEEALSCMNRRVIEAEERERKRIARDLHEDVGQRLALLAIAIEQLKNDLPDQTVELLDRMDAVWKQTLEILSDVKVSAHELYSPRLEYLGTGAVMRSFCEEFGERKRVEIDFKSHGLPSPVLPDVSICLFRVLQEALHNGVTHSGVQKFSVQLWGTSDEIHLEVKDSGVGFDVEAARRGRGLGLVSMEERLKFLEGTLSIESQPKRGTTIHARVPLSSGHDSIREAG